MTLCITRMNDCIHPGKGRSLCTGSILNGRDAPMGHDTYQAVMRQRLRDLSIRIDSIHCRLGMSPHDGLRRELAEQLVWLEHRRDLVLEKLDALRDEPDGTWDDLRAELEDAWDSLMQDFEERVAGLA